MWKGSRLSGKGTRWERVAATRRSLTFTVSQRNQEHFFFFGKISKILLSDKERAKKFFLNMQPIGNFRNLKKIYFYELMPLSETT